MLMFVIIIMMMMAVRSYIIISVVSITPPSLFLLFSKEKVVTLKKDGNSFDLEDPKKSFKDLPG